MKRLAWTTIFVLAACAGDTASTMELQTETDLSFDQPATATVLLWGYDDTIADVSATLIESYQIEVDKLPIAFDLDIPADPHELIDPPGFGPVAQDDANFYFSVYVDIDGDGQICAGDLVQDYDITDWESFATPPTTLSVALKAKTQTTCQDPLP